MSLMPAVTADPWQAAAERPEIRDQSCSGTAVSARGAREQDRDLGLEPWPQAHSTAGAMPGVTSFLCAGVWFLHIPAGVSGAYAHVCVCRCMYMFVEVPACVCTCAQVVVMWVDARAHVHFGGCMALCVCTHPCRGCAHLEESQHRQSSGVLSVGLCLWGLSPTSCSSPTQKQPLLHDGAQCPHSLTSPQSHWLHTK